LIENILAVTGLQGKELIKGDEATDLEIGWRTTLSLDVASLIARREAFVYLES
jgi:hypothetical protein